MAEDSAKAVSKDKLKFFKRAEDKSNEVVRATEDGAKEAEVAETVAAGITEAQGGDVRTESPAPAEVEVKTQKEKAALMPLLAPTLALAVRVLVILAVIIADAYAAYFLVVKGISPRMVRAQVIRAQTEAAEEELVSKDVAKEAGEEAARMGTITPVEDIVINPAGSGGTRYLCTTVALEVIEPRVAEEVAGREPQIRDALIRILSERTVEDLGSLQTRELLRAEIKVAVNDLLVTGDVVGVYFSNFVLQ
jgi:flagellar FliL protein